MEEKKISYIEKQRNFIDEEFNAKFLMRPDRQVAYLTGMYYNNAASGQIKEFNTRSLLKRLPVLSKNIDNSTIVKMIDECTLVMRKISSTFKDGKSYVPHSQIRQMIFDLLKQDISWISSTSELNIAFQMGYDAFVK